MISFEYDDDVKVLLERFHQATEYIGYNEEAIKTLFVQKLRAKQCLEIIYQGQTTDRLCQQILNEVGTRRNSLQTSIGVQYNVPIDPVGSVNEALNLFEESYKISIEHTLPIREHLPKQRAVTNTAELSFEERQRIIEASSQTLSLWEQWRTKSASDTFTALSATTTQCMAVQGDTVPVLLPQTILMAKRIDELKQSIPQEDVVSALRSLPYPEAAKKLFDYVYTVQDHLEHLFNEYIDVKDATV